MEELKQKIKNAYSIKFKKAQRGQVDLLVTWLDVHGRTRSKSYTVEEGQVLDF
ncbi:MAG: hypothetical protein QXN55_08105 [Candidatus Nitrosotenuis sp.]